MNADLLLKIVIVLFGSIMIVSALKSTVGIFRRYRRMEKEVSDFRDEYHWRTSAAASKKREIENALAASAKKWRAIGRLARLSRIATCPGACPLLMDECDRMAKDIDRIEKGDSP